jgi:hypothetical protein
MAGHSRSEIVMSVLAPSWKHLLSERLPLLGHRNWIGIVDAAYPFQTAPGIETVATGTDHLPVLEEVLRVIGKADHIRPRVLLDAELAYLSETGAPGIGGLRTQMLTLLAGHAPSAIPHEDIIAKLDAASRLFHILLLKTTLTLPYTSVFLELDCGYWSDEAERDLRASLPPL